jgi:transposase-like protein
MGDLDMAGKSHGKSRRKTPWDGANDLTPTQKFLQTHYQEHYAIHHPKLKDTGEASVINSYVPTRCPFCSGDKFVKRGLTANGIQRYLCACGRTFVPSTQTIFDGHKIAVSEWIEYCLNLFRYLSINADSWNNKNAFSTSKYWLNKLFLVLSDCQNSIVLSGNVWLDETYYPVINSQIDRKEDGTKYRGLSHNQICIGVATDKKNTCCFVEGFGKPAQKKSFEAFSSHIATGSTLIHDKEATHKKLVSELSLVSQAYASKDLKDLSDKDNPLDPVNDVHDRLKKFLHAHSGFNRDSLQDYLNLFAFLRNPPYDVLEKVDRLVNLAFQNPKSLRYREQFTENAGVNN